MRAALTRSQIHHIITLVGRLPSLTCRSWRFGHDGSDMMARSYHFEWNRKAPEWLLRSSTQKR